MIAMIALLLIYDYRIDYKRNARLTITLYIFIGFYRIYRELKKKCNYTRKESNEYWPLCVCGDAIFSYAKRKMIAVFCVNAEEK